VEVCEREVRTRAARSLAIRFFTLLFNPADGDVGWLPIQEEST
jgi:hypothetical protein